MAESTRIDVNLAVLVGLLAFLAHAMWMGLAVVGIKDDGLGTGPHIE